MIAIKSVSVGTPTGGRADVRVSLDDGKELKFWAALADASARPLAKGGFLYGPPALIVASLDETAVRTAVDAMAAELGGYWLRYYHSVRAKAESETNGASA